MDDHQQTIEMLTKRVARLERMLLQEKEEKDCGDPDAMILQFDSHPGTFLTSRQKIVERTPFGSKLHSAFDGRNDNPFRELTIFRIPNEKPVDGRNFHLFPHIILPFLNGPDLKVEREILWWKLVRCTCKHDIGQILKDAKFLEIQIIVDMIEKEIPHTIALLHFVCQHLFRDINKAVNEFRNSKIMPFTKEMIDCAVCTFARRTFISPNMHLSIEECPHLSLVYLSADHHNKTMPMGELISSIFEKLTMHITEK